MPRRGLRFRRHSPVVVGAAALRRMLLFTLALASACVGDDEALGDPAEGAGAPLADQPLPAGSYVALADAPVEAGDIVQVSLRADGRATRWTCAGGPCCPRTRAGAWEVRRSRYRLTADPTGTTRVLFDDPRGGPAAELEYVFAGPDAFPALRLREKSSEKWLDYAGPLGSP